VRGWENTHKVLVDRIAHAWVELRPEKKGEWGGQKEESNPCGANRPMV
jgi:hypothetical protein